MGAWGRRLDFFYQMLDVNRSVSGTHLSVSQGDKSPREASAWDRGNGRMSSLEEGFCDSAVVARRPESWLPVQCDFQRFPSSVAWFMFL